MAASGHPSDTILRQVKFISAGFNYCRDRTASVTAEGSGASPMAERELENSPYHWQGTGPTCHKIEKRPRLVPKREPTDPRQGRRNVGAI